MITATFSPENEIWKDIPGYEGLYQASNFGSIKALSKTYFTGENYLSKRQKTEHTLKQHLRKDGYKRIWLTKNGVGAAILVHRVIASVFVENKQNKKEVNHIDGRKCNNHFSNLEWCNRSENMSHAFLLGLKSSRLGGNHPMSKKILDTNTGIFYDCMKDAAKAKCISYRNFQNRLLGIVKNNTGMIYV